ncbi:MAG: FecR protein [Verrucomicrobiota bacterium]|nr:FecR protein [Verrucomicrobiota bacterium]
MKISTLLRFLSCAFVATALSLNALAQTELGQIKAARVQGDVQKISDAGTAVSLKDGDAVVQTDSIATGKGASVVLVFSNGSSVRLGSESRMRIDEFLADPLDAPINAADKIEPKRSKTTLNLSYGEMVGDVKKLNSSSSYSIKTPVGAAGIRGTIYRIVFRPSSDGKAFFQIQTAEGLVVMEGVTNAEVPVAEGKEVVVEIDTEKPDEAKVLTREIPPADASIIRAAAQEIVQTQQNATSGSTPPPAPPAEAKKEETPPPPPPPPVPDSPALTPGAGKT